MKFLDALRGRTSPDPARLLGRSGMMDVEYYACQAGVDFPDPVAAAGHYLATGAATGHSPHPLFEPDYLRQQRPDEPGEPALRYLTEPAYATLSPHPLFDMRAATRVVDKGAAAQPGGVWLSWVNRASADTPVPVQKGNPQLAWSDVRDALVAAAQQWRSGAAAPGAVRAGHADGAPAAISVVLPVSDDLAEALRRRRLLSALGDAELVYVGAARRWVYSCLVAAALGRRAAVVDSRATDFAELCNAGAGAASGDVLVFVAPGTELDAGAISALADRLADPSFGVVQPLVEDAVMNVHSAGAAFLDGDPVPSRLLAGHATSDAERMGDSELPAIWSPVFAIRAADLAALGGLAPGLGGYAGVDLSLRAREAGRGVPALVIAARATTTTGGPELGQDAGERFGRLHPVPPPGTAECLAGAGFAAAQGRLVPTRDATGPTPTLRWAIDIAATPGPWGERWGDLHFAKSLAAALRRLGQQVAIDHRGAGRRASREYDDVVLTLRGLYPVPAQPGRVNLLWVISHPDEVTADELRGYHRVFAAGPAWAAAKQADWGVRIDPLLQCTDITRFNPERAEPGSGPAVLFVGNTRHVSRPVVDHALRSGAAVSIYGTGWEDTSAAGHVIARNVPNADLGALYAGAGVVLNDHWADMRDQGFVSNRLFDAVACAARVLSDPVEGAAELFGDCVRYYAGADDVSRLLADPGANWPGLDERRAIARAVADGHSFDRRAEHLLAAAVEQLGGR